MNPRENPNPVPPEEPDPSDLHVAEVVKRDAKLHEANCAGHDLAKAVLDFFEVEEKRPLFKQRLDRNDYAKMHAKAQAYERVLRGVVSGASGLSEEEADALAHEATHRYRAKEGRA